MIINLFESDITSSLKDLSETFWGLRIPDSFYGKKPSDCDFIALSDSTMFGIECKMTTNGSKSFSFDEVTEQQKIGLKDIQEKGGESYILYNFRWMGTSNDKGKVFAISILEFYYLMYALDRKSIPLDYFQNNTLEVPKLELDEGGYGWDLRILL